MLGEHHERITKQALTYHLPADALSALIRGSTFPDHVLDVSLPGNKRTVLGAALCSTTHLCIRTKQAPEANLYRGWSWGMDPSITWLDVPNEDVSCDPEDWVRVLVELGYPEVLARSWAARHPQIRLDGTAGYSLAFDETTFAGANVMAEWFGELLDRALEPHDRFPLVAWFAGGCIAHVLEDQLVPYHANGWILWRARRVWKWTFLCGPTHSVYEARCWRKAPAADAVLPDPGDDPRRTRLPRQRVEDASDIGMLLTSPIRTNQEAHIAAVHFLTWLGSHIG